MERRTKMETSGIGRTVGDSDSTSAKNVANGNVKTLQAETKLQEGPEISASELESVVGGIGGAGTGKITFNPFQITRKLT
jgi:hypothetical protein